MSSNPLALVVESDAGTRRLLDVLLTRAGIEVDVVANGPDARLLLEHIDYDLVTLDLLLPALSGSDLLQWLAVDRPAALERTIVLSSAPDAQLERARQRWPGVRVIRKPFELEEILAAAKLARSAPADRALTAAGTFCRRSVLAGAKAGVIVRLRGKNVEPLLTFGYAHEQIAPFLSMTVDDPYPICVAIRTSAPFWCTSVARARLDYPILAPVWTKNESQAFAVVPIMSGEVIIGAVGWSYREPRLFGDAEQRTLLDIAAQATQLVMSSDTQPSGVLASA